MANPSIQIGNSNWAIKEDDLLGYSTVGTNYLPKPMTMTRASAGTRVNAEGLVNYTEIIGDSILTGNNSNFDTGIGSWVSYNGGTLAHSTDKLEVTLTTGESGARINTNSLISGGQIGKTFKVRARIWQGTSTNTNIKIYIGSVQENISISSTPTYFEVELTPTSTGMLTIYRVGGVGGIGTYFIDDVTVKEVTRDNLARVDYTDGTSSLLVEPQRRNLVTYSESISNLSSTTNGTGTFTITDNYTDSPQGLQNASRVQMSIVDTDDTNNYRLINTGSVMTSGVTREISFYAKSLTGSNQDVLVYWSYDQQIVTLTNDWQRFKISATSSNSGSVFIGTRGGSGSYFSGGDANLDFALWGYQIEDDGSGGGSSYATSYIPTSGSTVTRVKDQYEKTGISSLINSTEGVLFVEMAALADDGVAKYLTMNDGSSNNDVRIYFNTASNGISALLKSTTGATQAFLSYTVTDTTEFHKIAFVYAVNRFELWVDGEKRAEYLSGIAPVGLNTLEFSRPSNFLPLFAKVKQLQVFKTALKDEQLKTLTT